MLDLHARQETELNGLAHQRIGAGNHRLARDHSSDRRKQNHRQKRPFRREQEEGILDRPMVLENQRALPEIIQRQRRQDEEQPSQLNRQPAEVAHVGIERFGARDREEHGTEDEKAQESMGEEEYEAASRIEGEKHTRRIVNVQQAEKSDHAEKDCHDRPEKGSDPCRSVALNCEERNENHDRERQDVIAEDGRCDVQAFQGRKHGDRGRDDRVSGEERRPGNAEEENGCGAPTEGRLSQCHQRKNAALALIVGTHQEENVFRRHDEVERPEQKRHCPDDVLLAGGFEARVKQRFVQGVERARADVAIDDANGAEGQGRQACLFFRHAVRNLADRLVLRARHAKILHFHALVRKCRPKLIRQVEKIGMGLFGSRRRVALLDCDRVAKADLQSRGRSCEIFKN